MAVLGLTQIFSRRQKNATNTNHQLLMPTEKRVVLKKRKQRKQRRAATVVMKNQSSLKGPINATVELPPFQKLQGNVILLNFYAANRVSQNVGKN